MAAGDIDDMVSRLRAVLPAGWFPDDAPVLNILLQGMAAGLTGQFQRFAFARAQTRIATASGSFLDAISVDFFGADLPRLLNESDTQFARRIRAELLRERGTRAGLRKALLDLTGREPRLFEPSNAEDTGGYRVGGVGYGVAGGYGSLLLPWQGFVTAYRPLGGGIANVAGYGIGPGGYGVGSIEYASTGMIEGAVTDAAIYGAIAKNIPEGTTAWVAITV